MVLLSDDLHLAAETLSSLFLTLNDDLRACNALIIPNEQRRSTIIQFISDGFDSFLQRSNLFEVELQVDIAPLLSFCVLMHLHELAFQVNCSFGLLFQVHAQSIVLVADVVSLSKQFVEMECNFFYLLFQPRLSFAFGVLIQLISDLIVLLLKYFDEVLGIESLLRHLLE